MSAIATETIPLVDLKAQYHTIKDAIDAAIADVIANTSFIMGPLVADFEAEFAEYSEAKRGVGVSSGTTALHLALAALGVGPGDEVILPSHTFIATAEAIVHCGATPVFVDVHPCTYTVMPEHVEAAITPKTKAVMPVHIYGYCTPLGGIMELAEKHNLVVVEDCAQAHGARSMDGVAGAVGHAGAFSFYPGKNLGAYGDGGIVTTNDEDLADRMRMLANHGRTKKYEHDYVGWNYRLDSMQAAILSVKMKHIRAWSQRRLELARIYNEAFEGGPLELPGATDGHVFHLYVVRTDRREELQKFLKERGISSGIHYPIPCHKQPCFQDAADMPTLPVTEEIADKIVSLPLYPELTESQQGRIIEAVKAFFA